LVETSSIHWVESADQYVRLHTARGEILMRESMGALERSLDPTRFQRVHRSAIVALDQVRQLATQAGGLGKVQLLDETWVPVSRARIAALRRRLG
jgi:two-component system LytT family response regulator